LSKFRTTKRPRALAAVGGTVWCAVVDGRGGWERADDSALRGAVGVAAPGRGAGGAGGGAGSGAGGDGWTATETAGAAGAVSFGGVAQPARRDSRTTAAVTLL